MTPREDLETPQAEDNCHCLALYCWICVFGRRAFFHQKDKKSQNKEKYDINKKTQGPFLQPPSKGNQRRSLELSLTTCIITASQKYGSLNVIVPLVESGIISIIKKYTQHIYTCTYTYIYIPQCGTVKSTLYRGPILGSSKLPLDLAPGNVK